MLCKALDPTLVHSGTTIARTIPLAHATPMFACQEPGGIASTKYVSAIQMRVLEDINTPVYAAPQVSRGKGFHLVRGFPVQPLKDDRVGLVLAFWSLALHLGRPLARPTTHIRLSESCKPHLRII